MPEEDINLKQNDLANYSAEINNNIKIEKTED